MDKRHYWVGVVSKDHADAAVAGGFVQLGHGKAGPLERLRPGDGFAVYSPRDSHPAGRPLQAFTAIGYVADGPIYESAVTQDGPTFRRNATYFDATPAPIRPLLERLSFIRSKEHWGAALRNGLVRVPCEDFAAIARAMGRDLEADLVE